MRHDRVDHRHEADVRLVLQADDVERRLLGRADVGDVALVDDREAAGRQQALGLQLLAAEADHHHLVAEVRVQLMLRSVRIGIIASGASIATPQP